MVSETLYIWFQLYETIGDKMKKEMGIILGVLVLFGAVVLVEPVFAQEELNRNGFGKFACEHPLNDLTVEQREILKMYMEEHRAEIDEMMEMRNEMKDKYGCYSDKVY